VLWCLNFLFAGAIVLLPRNLPPLSPQASWLLLSAVVAAIVSVGVHLFLWEPRR
jgi:hypothetical protein